MTFYYSVSELILHSAANSKTTTLTKADRNDKEAILYHTRKLKKTNDFKFMNEKDQKIALEEEKKRVLEKR